MKKSYSLKAYVCIRIYMYMSTCVHLTQKCGSETFYMDPYHSNGLTCRKGQNPGMFSKCFSSESEICSDTQWV